MNECKYTIIKTLGEGAFGKAYLVKDRQGNFFAYKSLLLEEDANQFIITNPLELDILFRLESPHLLKGVDISLPGECMEEFGIISRYLKGDTKTDIIDMNFKQKKQVMFDIVQGLKCLHDNNYLHLDIKLENTRYYVKNGRLNTVLIDYGACSYTPYGVETGIITSKPRFTFDYTSPETCLSDKYDNFHYTNKSDIWALGITFLEIVADGFFEFIPDEILDLYEGEDPDMGFAELEKFLRYYFNNKNIDEFIEEYAFGYVKNIGQKDELKDLIKNMLKLKTKERYNIDQVLNHPFFSDLNSNNECMISKPQNMNLDNLKDQDLNKITNLVRICHKYFKNESSYILFMAVDIFLRVLHLNGYMENLEVLSILIAYKYFNWSEFDEHIEAIEIYNEEENLIYKILKGRIRDERYFSNCDTIEDVKSIYDYFIKPNGNQYNPNIKSYLSYNGNEFKGSFKFNLKLSERETFNLKIKDL